MEDIGLKSGMKDGLLPELPVLWIASLRLMLT
jgi:hypothetical protein